MPCAPYSPYPRFPWQRTAPGWPPFSTMPVIPETFRQQVSYEGQMHWLAALVNDAYLWTENSTSIYFLQGAQPLTSEQLASLTFGSSFRAQLPQDSPLPEWARCGDYVGLIQNYAYDSAPCMLVLEITAIDDCRLFFDSTFCYVIRDLTVRMLNAENDIAKLKTDVSKNAQDIADLQADVSKNEQDITNLQQNLENVAGDVQNLTQVLSSAHGIWRSSATDPETTAQIEAHQTVTVQEDGVRAGDCLLYRIPDSDFGGTYSLWVGFASAASAEGSAQFAKFAVLHDCGAYALTLSQDVATALSRAKSWVQAIVGKVAMGGTVNDDGSIAWNASEPIAVGNVNLYSSTDDPATASTFDAIYTHDPHSVADGDLWLQ